MEEDTVELAQFRARWKEELTFQKKENDDSEENKAIYFFKKALYYERKSKPFLAVEYYRKAFKLNPSLEHSRELQLDADWLPLNQPEKQKPQHLWDSNNESEVKNNPHNNVKSGSSQESGRIDHIPEWAISFLDAKCEGRDELENERSSGTHISNLPSELVINVISFLDGFSVESCSQVCRNWYILAREKVVWRSVCVRAWPNQLEALTSRVEREFHNNWRRLYIEKPRPRFDGVYISHNTYVRPGQTEGNYHKPVFRISYWRYLRFFPDGSVMLCCTPERPKIVVPLLNRISIAPKTVPMEYGSFDVYESTKMLFLRVEKQKETKKKNTTTILGHSCMLFDLRSTKTGWHNRLQPKEYYFEKEESTCEFDVNKIKQFKFFKVPDKILNPSAEL